MYHDIAEDLIASIQRGDFDLKLPTEQQLMTHYGVSRNTIRRAIDVVYQQGMLRRVQGSGYFINQVQVKAKATLNLSVGAGVSNLPEHPSSRVVSFDKVIAKDIPLARKMRINAHEELYRVIRLRYLHDQLYAYEEAYYLRSAIPFLSVESTRTSIFEFIKETYDISVTGSDDFISLARLTDTEAQLLESDPGAVRLALEQINYGKNNMIFNFARTIYAYEDLSFYFHSGHLSAN